MYAEISHTKYSIKIDGFTIYDYNHYDPHLKPRNLPIYVCGPWEPHCSNVKIENLIITTFNERQQRFQPLLFMDRAIVPQTGLEIGTIDTGDEIIIETELIIHNDTGARYQTLLEITSRKGQRYPKIELDTYRRKIEVSMTTILSYKDNIKNYDWSYRLNEVYRFYVKISQTEYIIKIDNITYVDYKQFNRHSYKQNVPIYACAQWSKCANVTMKNLIINASMIEPIIVSATEPMTETTNALMVAIITGYVLLFCVSILVVYMYRNIVSVEGRKISMNEKNDSYSDESGNDCEVDHEFEFSHNSASIQYDCVVCV